MPDNPALSIKPIESRQFLAFRIDDRLYALAGEEVAEVMRAPPLARVPQAPKSLLGLANLRGRVAPVASARALLGGEPEPDTDSGFVMVLVGAPVAVRIDNSPSLVSADTVQTDDAAVVARPGEQLLGVFSDQAGEVARILDIRGLLASAFVQKEAPRPARSSFQTSKSEDLRNREGDEQKLISFLVAGQEFALELDSVREIVLAPEIIAAVPHSEDLVIGVTAYRDGLLPLLSLRGLLGLGTGTAERSKVIVSTLGGTLVGLVADQATAIVSVGEGQSDPPPAVLAARTGSESQIKAIYRGDKGRRLISILSPEHMFRDDVMERLGKSKDARRLSHMSDEAIERAQDKFLVFRLGDDEFGLPIEAVIEVARIPAQITRVPKTPEFLEGVVNFRGEVLPVVDQRRRFDMPTRDRDASRRLIVVKSDRRRAGVIVDSVSEVLGAEREAIEPAPDIAGQAGRLVVGVINLEQSGRMVMVIDPTELLSRAERGLLDAFAPEITSGP